jgi:hypothetical protein
MCMYWLNFGRWSSAAGRFFVARRVYLKGYKWTPLVRLSRRRANPLAARKTLLDWAVERGVPVGWDPATNTVVLGGKRFKLGQIPGTYYDPVRWVHFVDDEKVLERAVCG